MKCDHAVPALQGAIRQHQVDGRCGLHRIQRAQLGLEVLEFLRGFGPSILVSSLLPDRRQPPFQLLVQLLLLSEHVRLEP